jgi:hypothetical protein
MRFQWFIAVLCCWVHRELNDVIAFLREENRVLKAQLRESCGHCFAGQLSKELEDSGCVASWNLQCSGLRRKGRRRPQRPRRDCLAARDAINAAGRGVLFFPRGRFVVRDELSRRVIETGEFSHSRAPPRTGLLAVDARRAR